MKPGGYCAIFGHPKTNHKMKTAFENVGFRIVRKSLDLSEWDA